MSDLVAPNGTVLDRTCQRICWSLWDSDEPLTTTQLRDELDVNQNQQILYQIERYLGRDNVGFVVKVGKRSTRGPSDVTEWGLTSAGREWTEDNMAEIVPPQTLDEALQHIDGLEEQISSLEKRIQSVEGQVGWDEKRLQRVENSLDDLDSRLSAVATDAEEIVQRHRRNLDFLNAAIDEVRHHADWDPEVDPSEYAESESSD